MKKLIAPVVLFVAAALFVTYNSSPDRNKSVQQGQVFDSVSKDSPIPVDGETAIEFKELKEESDLFEISFTYPRTGILPIDLEIEKIVFDNVSFIKESAADAEDFIKDFGVKYASLGEAKITRNDDQFLSVRFPVYQYTGGAHGISGTHTFVFNKVTGKVAELEDIFDKDTAYLFAISDIAIKQFRGKDISDDDWINDGAGPLKENFGTFVLTDTSIIFIFDEYSVGPFSAGIQEVEIPLNGITDLLRPNII